MQSTNNVSTCRKALIYLINLKLVADAVANLGSAHQLAPEQLTNIIYDEVTNAAKTETK